MRTRLIRSKSTRSLKPQPEPASTAALPRPVGEPVEEGLVSRVLAERTQAVHSVLGQKPNLRKLCRLVQESYELLSGVYVQLLLDPSLACAKGCGHCCYNPVSLTPIEALYLGEHIARRFSDTRRALLAVRMQDILKRIRGKSRQELGLIRHELPCPFLEEGACSVHAARPLVCRGWNSVDAGACQRSLEYQDAQTPIESHALMRDLADAVQLGMLRGSGALGLEAGFLVMTRALHLMLERGVAQTAEDWLSGRPFFGRPTDW